MMALRAGILVTGVILAGCTADSSAPDVREVGGLAGSADRLHPALRRIGTRLEPVVLSDPEGAPKTLEFSGQPFSVLLVVGAEACYSCIDIVHRSWRIRGWAAERGGRLLGVVAADDIGIARNVYRDLRLPFAPVVDTIGWAARLFRDVDAYPLLVVLDDEGIILAIAAFTRDPTHLLEITSYLDALAAWGEGRISSTASRM